jgi:hypothetical protein
MKKNVTYVSQSSFAAIAAKLGLTWTEQAGFVKVQVAGKDDYRLYVAKTKTVGRVDISGFEPGTDVVGFKHLGGESFGAVKAQLDFAQPEAVILHAFEAACLVMASLPAKTAAERDAAKKTRSVRASGGSVKQATVKVEPIANRLTAIRAYAEKNGFQISKRTLSQVQADEEPALAPQDSEKTAAPAAR